MERVFISKKECCGCGACVNSCTKNCIVMKRDEEGFFYPEIDHSQCINCGKCKKVCPFLSMSDEAKVVECHYAFNKNDEIRMNSSSGGVFSAFALGVIGENGVVYGSAFSEDYRSVNIVFVDKQIDAEKLYGSKYVQSNAGYIYQQVKSDVLAGKKVLFSGTPCQISALKSYLGHEYSNLICVDIICHGTPSPGLWEMYVDFIEEKHKGKLDYVNFRCKDSSWKDFGMMERINKEWIYSSKNSNPYMHMFLRNYSLRPSCYHCKCKGHSVADISIGDFWGIEDLYPELNDGKGVSAVITRTTKGQEFLKYIEDTLVIGECKYSEITRKNSAELHSVAEPDERKQFFVDMNQMNFLRLQNKYVGSIFKQKVKRLLKKLSRKRNGK